MNWTSDSTSLTKLWRCNPAAAVSATPLCAKARRTLQAAGSQLERYGGKSCLHRRLLRLNIGLKHKLVKLPLRRKL